MHTQLSAKEVAFAALDARFEESTKRVRIALAR
jgi:hypothetical protein